MSCPVVYVLFSYYGDRSGARLIEIFTDVNEAHSAEACAKACEPMMLVKLIEMPLDQTNVTELFP